VIDGCKPAHKSDSGFSMLEMLVVMLILSMTVSIAYFRFDTSKPEQTPFEYLQHLSTDLSAERAFALNSGVTIDVIFDLSSRFIKGTQFQHEIPDHLKLIITTGKEAILAERTAHLRFMPDGSSIGAEIRAIAKDDHPPATIKINWLTGTLRIAAEGNSR